MPVAFFGKESGCWCFEANVQNEGAKWSFAKAWIYLRPKQYTIERVRSPSPRFSPYFYVFDSHIHKVKKIAKHRKSYNSYSQPDPSSSTPAAATTTTTTTIETVTTTTTTTPEQVFYYHGVFSEWTWSHLLFLSRFVFSMSACGRFDLRFSALGAQENQEMCYY